MTLAIILLASRGVVETANTLPLSEYLVGTWVRHHGIFVSSTTYGEHGERTVVESWDNGRENDRRTYNPDFTSERTRADVGETTETWAVEGDARSGILLTTLETRLGSPDQTLRWEYAEAVVIIDASTMITSALWMPTDGPPGRGDTIIVWRRVD